MERGNDHTRSNLLVLTDTDGPDGTSWRAVVVYADGCLAVQGFDTGPRDRHSDSLDAEEFTRELSIAETRRVRELLGVDIDGDLLSVIAQRFTATDDLEAFLIEHGIPGTYRTGDE